MKKYSAKHLCFLSFAGFFSCPSEALDWYGGDAKDIFSTQLTDIYSTVSGSKASGNAGVADNNNELSNAGTITSRFYGSYNLGVNSVGGGNQVTNELTGKIGSSGSYIVGSYNAGNGSLGGSNTVTNLGTFGNGFNQDNYLTGSHNLGQNSSGGSNNVINRGNTSYIANRSMNMVGSNNIGLGSSGGDNKIENYAVAYHIYGSRNDTGTSGGDNKIFNYAGASAENIFGTLNSDSSGGGNYIENNGDISFGIQGSWNLGSTTSDGGGNTIINSGTVGTAIFGSLNQVSEYDARFVNGGTGGGNTIIITETGVVGRETSSVFINVYGSGSATTIKRASGGDNYLENRGLIYGNLVGSSNGGEGGSGGGNTVVNKGNMKKATGNSRPGSIMIVGTENYGLNSSGGNNRVSNESQTYSGYVIGTYNGGDFTAGSKNKVFNSGNASWVMGVMNFGDTSYGNDNEIANSGTAANVVGAYNGDVNSYGDSNTVENIGSVSNRFYGSYNDERNTHGGGHTVINYQSGTVSRMAGSWNSGSYSYGGGNKLTNAGEVTGVFIGSANLDIVSNGGANKLKNIGNVRGDFAGSWNEGNDSYGGGNVIVNAADGVAKNIYGSVNAGANTTGSHNTITNEQGAIVQNIYGSLNQGVGSSGGNNTINNSGLVTGSIYGSVNDHNNSSGGSNTIINTGIVIGDIIGSVHVDGVTSGQDTIINSGTVYGRIQGLNGHTYVHLTDWATTQGEVDGGDGVNTLAFSNMGLVDSGASDRFLNFDRFEVLSGENHLTGQLQLRDASEIKGGALYMNGVLSTNSLTVHNQAKLGGSGDIYGEVISYGLINPGNSIGTLTVGSLTLGSGSISQFEVDPEGSADKIIVSSNMPGGSGNAVINSGSTLSILASPGNWADSIDYTLIQADGTVTGQFETVKSNMAFLIPTVTYTANQVNLTLIRNKNMFNQIGTYNQRQTGHAVELLGAGNPIYKQIVGMSQEQSLQAFDNLSGEIHASTQTAFLTNSRYVRQAINQHQRGYQGPEGYSIDSGRGLWVNMWGHDGAVKNNGNAARLSHSGTGILVGIDFFQKDKNRLGLALGYGQNKLKIREGRDASADTDALDFLLYGDSAIRDFDIRGAVGYSHLGSKTSRNIRVGSLSSENKASYRGNLVQAYIEGSRSFEFSPYYVLTPYLSLTYQRIKQDAFAEKGMAAILVGEGNKTTQTSSALGMRAQVELKKRLLFYADLGWQYNLNGREPQANHRFIGSDSFNIKGAEDNHHVFGFGIGGVFHVSPNMIINAAYETQFGSHSTSQAAKVLMNLTF